MVKAVIYYEVNIIPILFFSRYHFLSRSKQKRFVTTSIE